MEKVTAYHLRMAGALWPILEGKISLDGHIISKYHVPEASSRLVLGWPLGNHSHSALHEEHPWLYEQPASLVLNDEEVMPGMAYWQSSSAGQTTVVWRSAAAAHWHKLKELTLGQLLQDVYLPYSGQPAGSSAAYDILHYNSNPNEALVFAPPLRAAGLTTSRHDIMNLGLVQPEQLMPQLRLLPLLDLLAAEGLVLELNPDQKQALKNWVFCPQRSEQHKALDWHTLGRAELSFSTTTYTLSNALRTVSLAEAFMPGVWPKPLYRCCTDAEHSSTLTATVSNSGTGMLYLTTVLFMADASGSEVWLGEQSYEIPAGQSLTLTDDHNFMAVQGCKLGMRAILSHANASWNGTWTVQPGEGTWSGISLGRLLGEVTVAEFIQSLCQAADLAWQYIPATDGAMGTQSIGQGNWYAQPKAPDTLSVTHADPTLEAAHVLYRKHETILGAPEAQQETVAAFVSVNSSASTSQHTAEVPAVSAQMAWMEETGWLVGNSIPEQVVTAAGLIPFRKLAHVPSQIQQAHLGVGIALEAALPMALALPYLDVQHVPYQNRMGLVVGVTYDQTIEQSKDGAHTSGVVKLLLKPS